MVDFRRVITALAVLALFAGLASAQVGGTAQTQLTCSTNVTVTPALRGEGYTEQTGDITITCTGGAPIAVTGNIPSVNISVFYNTTVTSRLLPTQSGQSSNQTSEALLLIDEPGSNLPGYGPAQAQSLCGFPLTGCPASVGAVAGTTFNTAVDGLNGTSTTPAKNVYQGVVNGNSVTFFGVPVMPPTTTGSRVYRITNVRVNAQPLNGGSASGASPVQASISISGATSLSISNSLLSVGFVSTSLTGSASGSTNKAQCSSQTRASINTLTFGEAGAFATAFKTRVQAASTSQYAGQINTPVQNVPGGIYNSESNFVFPIGSGQVAGLADFGTRLKATFTSVPAGVRIFVSTNNVSNDVTPISGPPVGGAIGGSTGNGNAGSGAYVGFASLVNGESTGDGNAAGGFLPLVSASDNAGTVPIAEVALSGGTGSAIWEVLNTNPFTVESFKFSVYVTYSANVASNSPLPGTTSVNLSYAPTASSGAASSSLAIPRFAADPNPAQPIMTIQICRTILLYPYITNQVGFDTGITVANTTQDPYTTGSKVTGAQSGKCTFTYYGGTTAAPTTPPPATDTPIIAAGTVFAGLLSNISPSFQGYMFAVCNFQFAHGFAFISDVGARNLAMGYLAVVLDDPGANTARSNANTTKTENGAH